MPQEHVRQTSLSAPLSSSTTNRWKIAISTPIYRDKERTQLLAVIVLTIDAGDLLPFKAREDQVAVLVDNRQNGYQGMILDHPLLTGSNGKATSLASEETLSRYRVELGPEGEASDEYRDPLGDAPGGENFQRPWIAANAPVVMPRASEQVAPQAANTGLVVLVQQDLRAATRPIDELNSRLVRLSAVALVVLLLVVGLLWYIVFYVQGGRRWWRRSTFSPGSSIATPTPPQTRSTAAERPTADPKS